MNRYSKKISVESELSIICALENQRKKYLEWSNNGGLIADYWAKELKKTEQALLEIKENF